MRRRVPMPWDDAALVVLLLLIGVPRVVLAIVAERPIGAEGAASMMCVAFALSIVLSRIAGRHVRAS